MKYLAFLGSAAAYNQYASSSQYYNSYWEAKPADLQCGGTITAVGEVIASPVSGNGFYYDDLDCTWNVQLPESVTEFQVVARSFAVEICTDCQCDWLEIGDGNGNGQAYCGLIDPSTLRRRRAAEKKKDGDLATRGQSVYPATTDGLRTHTVIGNSATIRFVTDGFMVYKGFELVIGETTVSAPTTSTPTEAWSAIAAAAADVAVEVNDFFAALPGLGKYSVLASKKVARYNASFQKMTFLQNKASADPCVYPAGANDHAAFVAPVDSDDACEKMNGVFASLISFVDSYTCLASADGIGGVRWIRQIQRQRKMLVTKKLKQMKCNN